MSFPIFSIRYLVTINGFTFSFHLFTKYAVYIHNIRYTIYLYIIVNNLFTIMPFDCDHRRFVILINSTLQVYNFFHLTCTSLHVLLTCIDLFIIELQLTRIIALKNMNLSRCYINSFYFNMNKFILKFILKNNFFYI